MHVGVNGSYVDSHATNIAVIIKKMVPNCTLVASSIVASDGFSDAISDLLEAYPNTNVINISCGNEHGAAGELGTYTSSASYMDQFVKMYKIPIVLATGNTAMFSPDDDGYNNGCVSLQSVAPNVLSAGAVHHTGTNPSSNNAFLTGNTSSYNQYNGNQRTGRQSMVNKPDFCAPGDVILSNPYTHTSYSAPFIVGTISQIMSRNAEFRVYTSGVHRDLVTKAMLMASCFYNTGTEQDVYGIISSDKEGAGVINAGICYNSSSRSNKKYANYTLTSLGTTTKTISITDTTKPLRVALAWATQDGEDQLNFYNSNISLYVYKDYTYIKKPRRNQ